MLNELLSLNDDLNKAVGELHWERLTELLLQREILMQQTFEGEKTVSFSAEDFDKIRDLLTSDKKNMDRLATLHQEMAEDLSQINKGKTAVEQYYPNQNIRPIFVNRRS